MSMHEPLNLNGLRLAQRQVALNIAEDRSPHYFRLFRPEKSDHNKWCREEWEEFNVHRTRLTEATMICIEELCSYAAGMIVSWPNWRLILTLRLPGYTKSSWDSGLIGRIQERTKIEDKKEVAQILTWIVEAEPRLPPLGKINYWMASTGASIDLSQDGMSFWEKLVTIETKSKMQSIEAASREPAPGLDQPTLD